MPEHIERSARDDLTPVTDHATANVRLNRSAQDKLQPVTDHVNRVVRQVRIQRDRRFVALLAVLIIVPPLVTWLVALFAGFWGAVLGWAASAVAVWVGYKAIAEVTTIDRA